MPRITKTERPSVNAPNLTQNQQNINIPSGAFGEDEAAAITGLGGATANAANRLNQAFARQAERRSITEASGAFKDVPVTALADLEAAKTAARQDPSLLPTFQQDYTKAFDNKMKDIRDGLSERAQNKFDQKALSTGTSMAKSATVWARGEEILNGRNNMSAEISNIVQVATGDLLNLDQYRQDAIDIINEADANGFLIDGRGKQIDSTKAVADALRSIDLNIANSLIQENPESLQAMIEGDFLPNLTEKDKAQKLREIPGAAKNIKERADLTFSDSLLANRDQLRKARTSRTATYQMYEQHIRALDDKVEAGDVLAQAEQAWLEEEQKTSIKSREDIISEKAEKKEIEIEATKRARKAAGIQKQPKPSADIKAKAFNDFNEEFLDFAIVGTGKKKTEIGDRFELEDEDNPLARMTAVLDFWSRVSEAQRDGLLTEKEGNTFFEQLIPVMRSKIESKHFKEARDTPWWGAVKRAVGGQVEIERTADKYSDVYSSVLDTLGEAASSVDKRNAMIHAYDIIQATDFGENDSVVERVEKSSKIAQDAVQLMNWDKRPSTRGLKTNAVIELNPNEPDFQIMVDANGNKARVFKDGRVEEIN
jgi:hypothetical protein